MCYIFFQISKTSSNYIESIIVALPKTFLILTVPIVRLSEFIFYIILSLIIMIMAGIPAHIITLTKYKSIDRYLIR